MDEIEEFINRRFSKYRLGDCFSRQNCYYFAVILKDRFPEGKIYYDVIDGHFLYYFNRTEKFYDYFGAKYNKEIFNDGHIVCWDNFDIYDEFQQKRILRDCIN